MSLSQRSDEDLMTLYQNGNEEAFQVLYSRHSSKILGFIKSRVFMNERSHDIFQEVFMKIHKSKHLYNQNHPVLPWIFTITKNAITDEARKFKPTRNQIQIDDLDLAAPEVEASYSMSDMTQQLDLIPTKQKSAIEMRYVEEKTFEDIAEVLKTSEVNVRQLISRGIQRLKELMKEQGKP